MTKIWQAAEVSCQNRQEINKAVTFYNWLTVDN